MTAETHSIAYSIEFQMSLILFMALGGYLLSSRIGQPAVVGVILAGILIGPSGFYIVHFSDFIASMGHIGAIVLLFAVGLQSHIRMAARPCCFMVALGGVLVPWAGGYAASVLFGFDFTKSVIIGVILTATSLAITADTLRELGKINSQAAQIIIGAAVIDDILALLALMISKQLASGAADFVLAFFFIGKAIVFLLAGVWLGRKLLVPLISRVDGSSIALRHSDFVFIMTMMIAFLYAMIAEIIGLSAIIGAFLAGISLASLKAKHSKDFREGTDFLRIIFGAVFFVSLGILADISHFTWSMVEFVIVLTVVAVLSKVIGCGLIAKLSGISTRDSLIIGVGMSPRGEMAMAIALLAYTDGIIDQSLFGVLILVSLATTMIAPILLRNWLYRGNIRRVFTRFAAA